MKSFSFPDIEDVITRRRMVIITFLLLLVGLEFAPEISLDGEEKELPEPDVRENSHFTITVPEYMPSFFIIWGMENYGTDQFSNNTEFRTTRDSREAFSRLGFQTEMAWIPTNLVDDTINWKNASILPYKQIGTEKSPIVYVQEDSQIKNVSQLQGGKITVDGSVSALLTRFALDRGYNINSSNTDIVNMRAENAFEALEKGEIDAMMTAAKAQDERAVRPLMYPARYFIEAEDLSHPPLGLFFLDNEAKIDKGIEVIKLLDRSSKYGTANVENVTNYYMEESGRNLSSIFRSDSKVNNGDLIVPLTEKDEKTLQKMFDFAYQENLLEISSSKANISKNVLRPENLAVFPSDSKVNNGDLIVPLTEKDEKTLQKMFDFPHQENLLEISSSKANISKNAITVEEN